MEGSTENFGRRSGQLAYSVSAQGLRQGVGEGTTKVHVSWKKNSEFSYH